MFTKSVVIYENFAMYIEIVKLVRMDRFSIRLVVLYILQANRKWPFDNYAPFP